MQTHATGESAGAAANAYVVRYAYSIDTAMDAGRFFQARVLRWCYAILTAGFLGGAAIVFLVPRFLEIGLWAVLFCGPMLVLLHFSVLGRLLGRRHYRSLLGKVIEIKVGEDGIAWEGPLWTGAAPWTTVTEVQQTIGRCCSSGTASSSALCRRAPSRTPPSRPTSFPTPAATARP